jgi:hypothetical protein
MLSAATGQEIFTIDIDTGTIVRTLVTTVYDKNIQEEVGRLKYRDFEIDGLTMKELLKMYIDKFGGANKDLSMASGPICSAEIRHSSPSLGTWVVDHPGFVLKDKEGHTTFATMNSIDKFVANGASILCLTQSIEVEGDF